jgi:4'-phosphopantetheinyl transferase
MKAFSAPAGDPKRLPETAWSQASSSPAFPNRRVHVWRVHLYEPPTTGSDASVLSLDEITRAGRFHFEKDRTHFTRCRSALRRILADYLSIPATEIRFEYLNSGKPQPQPSRIHACCNSMYPTRQT